MNPVLYIPIALGYFAIGIIWGFFRWLHFVDSELNYYEQEKQRFLFFHRIRGANEIPEFLTFDWRELVQKNERLKAVPPDISDYRGEIGFDVILWPVAILLWIIQKVFTVSLYHLLSGYNKVTEKKLERVRKDLKR